MAAEELSETLVTCWLHVGSGQFEGSAQLFEFVRGDLEFWFARVVLPEPIVEPLVTVQFTLEDGRSGRCFFRGMTMRREGADVRCCCDVVGVTPLEAHGGTC